MRNFALNVGKVLLNDVVSFELETSELNALSTNLVFEPGLDLLVQQLLRL